MPEASIFFIASPILGRFYAEAGVDKFGRGAFLEAFGEEYPGKGTDGSRSEFRGMAGTLPLGPGCGPRQTRPEDCERYGSRRLVKRFFDKGAQASEN